MNSFVEDMETTRRAIGPLIDKWASLLVPTYRVHVEWHYDRIQEQFESCAWVTSDWRYLDACVHIGLPRMCAIPEEDWQGIVVHELTHLLVAEMREWASPESAMPHEERVVTVLARLLENLPAPASSK